MECAHCCCCWCSISRSTAGTELTTDNLPHLTGALQYSGAEEQPGPEGGLQQGRDQHPDQPGHSQHVHPLPRRPLGPQHVGALPPGAGPEPDPQLGPADLRHLPPPHHSQQQRQLVR